jgi:hypothetical protein
VTRPAELIVSFTCRTVTGYVGPDSAPAVLLTIGGSDEEDHPTFAFRPEQARVIGEECGAVIRETL